MLKAYRIALCLAGVGGAAAALAGCGKPEDASYTAKPQDEAAMAALHMPLPPAPSWAATVVGQPVAAVTKGSATCKGAVDVTFKHAGPRGGDEVQGWAWDVRAKQPLARILLTDAAARVIGAGAIDRNRVDVAKSLSEVKTSKVGWTAVTRSTKGVASVMGVTQAGAVCAIGSAELS